MQPPVMAIQGLRGTLPFPWQAELENAIRGSVQAHDFSGALSIATVVLEDYIRSAADPPADISGRGAGDLIKFAFAPPNGRLTRHLSGSVADGISKLLQGLFQSIRNPVHHQLGSSNRLPDAVYALDSINYAYQLTRTLAAETYLNQFLSGMELHSLLKVRHLDLDNDGILERVVTYSCRNFDGTNSGRVLVTKIGSNNEWTTVGKLTTELHYLIGDILLDKSDTPVAFCIFGGQGAQGNESEAIAFTLSDQAVQEVAVPPEARFSSPFLHELKQHLGNGEACLLAYSRDNSGAILRKFWRHSDGRLQSAAASERAFDFLGTTQQVPAAQSSPSSPLPATQEQGGPS